MPFLDISNSNTIRSTKRSR